MSKKKKDKIEEPSKKTKAAAKEKPAKTPKGIVPSSMPVLVPAANTNAEAPVPPAAPASAPAPKAKKAPARKAPAKKKEKAAKSAKEISAAEPVDDTVTVGEIIISNDDIALRAYFISEARRSRGHWGDEHGDWVEAERQLRAEAAAQKK